jgi:predicted alpha/beta-fold hydrolase
LFTLGGFDDVTVALKKVGDEMFPRSAIVLVGFSMGANIAVRAGASRETRHKHVQAIISISQGYDAQVCGNALNRFYSGVLLRKMLDMVKRHRTVFEAHQFDVDAILKATTPHEFDERLTLRVHSRRGWRDANHYYSENSSLSAIADVDIPLLCLNALDDPIVVPALVSTVAESALHHAHRCLVVATVPYGGHLGFTHSRDALPLLPARECVADVVAAVFAQNIVRPVK